uniref:Uncharacterized protein n=1 Tax=Oryza sativa subsp. japonica TaxID=39947 RepID=Q6I607_ORYSJ|nr:unknown protein [Oryza sativa Japonica Group]
MDSVVQISGVQSRRWSFRRTECRSRIIIDEM